MNMLNRQETAAIERRSLVESVSATGSVVSAGSKSVTAEVTGVKSLSVPVEVGDMVTEGDLLCLLDTADLEESLANSASFPCRCSVLPGRAAHNRPG